MMDPFFGVRCRRLAKSLVCFVRRPFVLFCIVLLVSAFCKLSALGSRELWLDETYSAFVANLHFSQLLRHISGDCHPPLFYILLWGWIRVFGDAQVQLRLFGVVLSVCGTIAMFILAKRLLGVRFGAFAAVLFAFSPMLFVYSLEVRMYMLSILVLICLLIVHWIVVVEQSNAKRLVVAYGMLAALLFYVHYIGVFILLGLFVHWAIVSSFARSSIVSLVAAGTLTALLVSPWIPVMLEQRGGKAHLDLALKLSHQNPDSLSLGATDYGRSESNRMTAQVKSAAAMAGFYRAPSSLLLLLCAIPLAVALTGAGFLGLAKGDQVCLLFVIVSIAIGIGMVTLQSTVTRFLLPLVPLLVLAISRAIQYWAASARWRAPSLAVGTLILCLYTAGFFRQAYMQHGRPWQNLVDVVQYNYRPGDRIVFDVLYSQVPFDYFARQAHFQSQESGFPISIYEWWEKQRVKAWGGPVIMQSDLNQFVSDLSASRPKTLWLVLYETYYYDPHDALLVRLRQLGTVTEVRLPPDPDTPDSKDQEALRLFRISIN